MPSILPPFLIAGHGALAGSPFANVAMTTGHRRKRRVCTVRPQVVSVSLFLEPAEATAFHAWHRDSLRSGERHFAARVKEQGAGQLWYDAFWLAMYQAEALHFGRWVITGQLQLRGDGQVGEPTLGGFHASVTLDLQGSAVLTVTKAFHATAELVLLDAAPVEIES